MQQLVTALLFIVGGVGLLALYFWGSNWLLDNLLPDFDERRRESAGLLGSPSGISIPDALTAGLGILLLASFALLPWVSLNAETVELNATGAELPQFIETFETLEIDEEVEGFRVTDDAIDAFARISGIARTFRVLGIVAVLLGAWGLLDGFRQRVAALLASYIGALGILLVIVLIMTLIRLEVPINGIGGLGIWVSSLSIIGLFVQTFLPRPPISDYSRSIDLREGVRPWLFVGPALLILGVYLVYPAVQTFFLSFGNADGDIRIFRTDYPDEVDAELDDLEINLNAPVDLAVILEFQATLAEDYPEVANITGEELQAFDSMEEAVNHLLAASGDPPRARFILLRNYRWAVEDQDGVFWQSIRNNFLWLLVVPIVSTAFGLLVAVLADRVRWGNIAKSLIFLPMAISFIGASVIWNFVYDANLPNPGNPIPPQIGSLNALVVALGGQPHDWITIPFWNNFFLMVILIWIQTGFAMVILGAALRGVPEETLEAARIDGANEIAIFFRIMIPQIMSTILVVLTTITIVVLKVFDIVLAMTNGQFGTEVLANLMFDQMFRGGGHFGRSSMVAIVIMVAVIPILVWNIRRFQEEEAFR